ncbi:MAG: flagellar hook basal-body protein [Nitrospirota bacterium]
MYKGIYVAMTGAVLRSQELDNVANNLANASTTGYKKGTFSSRLYPLMEDVAQDRNSLYPDARAMTYFGTYSIDVKEGNLRTTGNPLDLAIRGEGFFAVEGKGNIFYTRNGSFSKSKEGFLVTERGQRVLDTANKPIRIEGREININAEGTVYVDGNAAGKIKMARLVDIQHIGESLFTGTERGIASGDMVQGSTEMSNVNPVREMVGIITALRQYDSAQKVIQNFNELSQRSVSEIAKV